MNGLIIYHVIQSLYQSNPCKHYYLIPLRSIKDEGGGKPDEVEATDTLAEDTGWHVDSMFVSEQ